MIREHGNMWSIFNSTDYFLITTNSYIRQDGELVMGRGMAYQMKKRIPNTPRLFAEDITHMGEYGLVTYDLSELYPDIPMLGCFQVKTHYREAASSALIKQSTEMLQLLSEDRPDIRFDLNCPGIGNGRMAYEIVRPIIQALPDNVHIWTYV